MIGVVLIVLAVVFFVLALLHVIGLVFGFGLTLACIVVLLALGATGPGRSWWRW